MRRAVVATTLTLALSSSACSGDDALGPAPLPRPACDPAGGNDEVAEPVLRATLFDRFHEAWLGSPAVADLDGDGAAEIVVTREGLVLGWHADGALVFRAEIAGRAWSSPVVADLVPGAPGLEVAVAARGNIYMWRADAQLLPGFPYTGRDELRSLAAGDIDGDGALELVAMSTTRLEQGSQSDVLIAIETDGGVVPGFPPNTSGAAGCDVHCFVTGGYDQNVALGDLDGDGRADILAPHDNAYLSVHDGSGRAFDCDPGFEDRTKIMGVRFLHELAQARQGYADEEDAALQAHFTNTAPAIADLDSDGVGDIVALGSVQTASQHDRQRGVALWAVRPDGTRLPGWEIPFHVPAYLAGLVDLGDNIAAATNQVAVAELDPDRAGPELVFAGFDGQIHAVDGRAQPLWATRYTSDAQVLTSGVAIADLSADGVPELVFATYSLEAGKAELVVMDAAGNLRHAVPLPDRGAMAVPTIADTDGDGRPEIVVNLKDGADGERQVLVFAVATAAGNCLVWPTGRGTLRRDGFLPPD